MPQSVTVVTEKLIDDRNLDTLKEALQQHGRHHLPGRRGRRGGHPAARLLAAGQGDIFIDGMRDPAFYDRDTFNWDRLEVLRGSASMLFGRGSTGGAVNQVRKQPLDEANEVDVHRRHRRLPARHRRPQHQDRRDAGAAHQR